jgi:hypothetical protein
MPQYYQKACRLTTKRTNTCDCFEGHTVENVEVEGIDPWDFFSRLHSRLMMSVRQQSESA